MSVIDAVLKKILTEHDEAQPESFSSDKPDRPSLSFVFYCALVIWLISLGFVYMSAHTGNAGDMEQRLPDGEYEGVIVDDGYITDFSRQYIFKTEDISGKSIRVSITTPQDVRLLAHEYVSMKLNFKEVSSEEKYRKLRLKNIWAQASASNIIRDKKGIFIFIIHMRSKIINYFEEYDNPASHLACALITGYRNSLFQEDIYESLKNIGLAHVVAISGAHVSLVIVFLQRMLNLFGTQRSIQIGIIGLFLVLYIVFSGFNLPVLRASSMTIIAFLSFFRKRRAHALSALSAAISIILCVDPWASCNISFILSALATLSIIVFFPWFTYFFRVVGKDYFRALQEATALSLSAHIGIFPIVASLFSRIPLLSPLATLISTPFIITIMGLGLIGSLIYSIQPFIGSFVLHGVIYIAGIFHAIVLFVSHISVASAFVDIPIFLSIAISLFVSLFLWIVWPSMSYRGALAALASLGCIFVSVSILHYVYTPDRIIVLDVGQGDAILIQSKHENFLIDTGTQDTKLMSALARAHVGRLKGVLITHHDDDHCGSLITLQGKTSHVYVSSCVSEYDSAHNNDLFNDVLASINRPWEVLHEGDVIRIGNFNCLVVWPHVCNDAGGNADSLCLYVEYDSNGDGLPEATALMTGDAEQDQIDEILKNYSMRDIDVLKVGHHGSKKSLSYKEAQILRPKISCISVGKNNTYGHPTQELLDVLDEVGSQVFRTDFLSDVTCIFSSEGITVKSHSARVEACER